jgi:hypothetical protein
MHEGKMANCDFIENTRSTFPYSFLDTIRNGLHNVYNKNGESKEGIHAINMMAKEFYRQLQNTPFYWSDLKPLIADAAECDHYHAYNLNDDEKLEFSVHVMPKGCELPMQAHPGKFSLIMVEYGDLSMVLGSVAGKWLQSNCTDTKILMRGDTCVSLPVRNNIYQLKAISDIAVFITLRVDSEERETMSIVSQLFSKRFTTPD